MSEAVIEVQDLRRSYGEVEAVRGVSFSVVKGEVFALLGPNGAGKTTTVEILEGFRRPSAGKVSVLGHDPAGRSRRLRERIGIVLQSTGIDPYLTVIETIEMYAAYFPRRRPAGEVIDLVGLTEHRHTKATRLSGGQQRRLDVAIALAGDPDLLFLDEPTTGFDPAARRGAWEIVRNLAALDKTVFLTTHYMDEAQQLADRVAVITDGRIVAEGPPSQLGGRDESECVVRFGLAETVATLPFDATKRTDGKYEVFTFDPTSTLYQLTAWAIGLGIRLDALEVTRPSLEEVYLRLTDGNRSEQ